MIVMLSRSEAPAMSVRPLSDKRCSTLIVPWCSGPVTLLPPLRYPYFVSGVGRDRTLMAASWRSWVYASLDVDRDVLALVRLAADLGAERSGGPLTDDERQALQHARELPASDEGERDYGRAAMLRGEDPLGARLARVRPAVVRRAVGAFYTPPAIVRPMVAWLLARDPSRVVDAGCGSGRFSAAVARLRPDLAIVAVDSDPVATLMTRAALHLLGTHNARVLQADYTAFDLPPITGRTGFIGNPPYVRHHDLPAEAKAKAARMGAALGYRVSGLAGLHTHFLLATMLSARPGDPWCFVTSAEWLDVAYGSVIRSLFLDGFGGASLDLIAPSASAFEDVQTTAVIACGDVGGRQPWIRLDRLDHLDGLERLASGRRVDRAHLLSSTRWSPLFRGHADVDDGRRASALGSIARVHRGLVTGANDFFVLTRERARALELEAWCRPAITDAREILDANGTVRDAPTRKLLLALPRDLDRRKHSAVDRYLRWGETRSGDRPALSERYIPSHRSPW